MDIENSYKEYNNFIRDMVFNLSAKYNKKLFYENDQELVVYFEILNDMYLREIIYLKPGFIFTLLTNVITCEKLRPNSMNHIVQVKLKWYNIFMILNNYSESNTNEIILPYGTQLMIVSISQINNMGNYIISATCINTLSLLEKSNINDFIKINRKKRI